MHSYYVMHKYTLIVLRHTVHKCTVIALIVMTQMYSYSYATHKCALIVMWHTNALLLCDIMQLSL